jgi:hypothetical protein
MAKLGMLDTSITSHQELVEKTKEKLEEQEDWIDTPDLVEELDKENLAMKEDYIRGLLTYIRQHLKNQGEIEVKTEREGGHATYYWRRQK